MFSLAQIDLYIILIIVEIYSKILKNFNAVEHSVVRALKDWTQQKNLWNAPKRKIER